MHTSADALHDESELLALTTTKTMSNAKRMHRLQRVLQCPNIGEVLELQHCEELRASFCALHACDVASLRFFSLFQADSISPVMPCVVLAISTETHRFLSLSADRRVLCGVL